MGKGSRRSLTFPAGQNTPEKIVILVNAILHEIQWIKNSQARMLSVFGDAVVREVNS